MEVSKNKVVSFEYVLKDKETGEVLDASQGQPLTFLVGAGYIIPGLEERMLGMKEGEKKTIEVPAEEAYGIADPNLIQVQKAPREYFEGIDLEVGLPLIAQTPEGQPIQLVVLDFDENTVTVSVDLNHPLAGRDLVFDVEIKSIREATPDEILHGYARNH